MYRKAAIVGIGQTDYSMNSGRSEWRLALEAILSALADAGLSASEVDGIVRYSYDNVTQPQLVRSLGITDLRYFADVPLGGTACCAVVGHAAAAIAAGLASVVVVFRALNERSGVRYGRAERNVGTDVSGIATATGERSPAGAFSAPYGLLSPGQVMALWACRYEYEYGLKRSDLTATLGAVAIQQRSYAAKNPNAIMRDRPLDMTQYLAGRMIAEPLRLYDYCLESDGAAAVVLVSADRARELRDDAAYILSAAQSMYPYSEPVATYVKDMTVFAPSRSIERLYADARLKPEDISVVELYDATSIMVPLSLEIYEFASRGEGWRAILEKGIGPDSPLPVNTHGGHLSEAYVHGMNHIVEGVRQLRGTSPNSIRQVDNVLIGAHGASSLIIGR